MNENNCFFGKDKNIEAAKQLGLSDDCVIQYMATRVSFIYDPEDVTCQLDETYISIDDVETAVSEAVISVELPKGFLLIGMRKTDNPDESMRYGFVNFEPLG